MQICARKRLEKRYPLKGAEVFYVDSLEPLLPAKVTADQALKFAESLARGEPNRKKIALTAVSDEVRKLVGAGKVLT